MIILCAENETYGLLILEENISKKKDKVDLPKAVGKKVSFQEPRVSNFISEEHLRYIFDLYIDMQKHDVFQWKMINLTADIIVRLYIVLYMTINIYS